MDISRLTGRYGSGLPESPLPLLSFAGEEMAFKTFGSLDLTGGSDPEPFHRPSFAFYLGHVFLLLFKKRSAISGQLSGFS